MKYWEYGRVEAVVNEPTDETKQRLSKLGREG